MHTRRLVVLAIASFSAACNGDKGDSGDDIAALCAGEGSSSVVIGQGVGSDFYPFEGGETVGLSVAPQGGFGVEVRAATTGLTADDDVPVLLVTEIDGVEVGSFLNESVQLYCQDDGTGLLWGVVVGFDPAVYSTNDDLLSLEGQEVDLVVTITDDRGVEGVGRASVIISVGG